MLRRRVRLTALSGAVVTLACLVWATRPIDVATDTAAVDLATTTPTAAPTPTVQTPLLAARLWNPPPAPALQARQSEEGPAPPPPYQLIGIIHEDGELKAALYDPGTDRVLIVRSGDRIESLMVVAVNERSVEISDGTRSSTIILKEERS